MRDLLDLDLHPLDRPAAAEFAALVARCRKEIAAAGMFNLDGLLRPEAIARVVAEIAPKLAREAFTHRRAHNIYFRREIPGLAPDHPALRQFETVNHTICADQIADSLLMRLYHWPPLAAFLA